MKTALQSHVSSCLKELFNSSESSNFNVLPTLSYQRPTMNIYSGISNGSNPTFSSLNIRVTQSYAILFIYLSGFCSARSVQSIYSKLHVSLQQFLICSSVIACENERFEIIVHFPLTQTNSHYSDVFKVPLTDWSAILKNRYFNNGKPILTRC